MEDQATQNEKRCLCKNEQGWCPCSPNFLNDVGKDHDIKAIIKDLSSIYKHSKNCDSCSEKLAKFLADINKELCIKVPKIQPEYEYKAEPSNLITSELGPGSIVWDPNKMDVCEIEPMETKLLETVKFLEEKCRIKDAMIETLACEFLKNSHLDAKTFISELVEYPSSDPPDFNRYSLFKYLNNEKTDGFDEIPSEKEVPTNPLGLRIVRQVGPDGLLLKWDPPLAYTVSYFELLINGCCVDKIKSPGRTRTMIHPVNLNEKVVITLNTISCFGTKIIDSAQVTYSACNLFSCFGSFMDFFFSKEPAVLGENENYKATNPLGLEIVTHVRSDGLYLKWKRPPLHESVYGYEIYANGVFMTRISTPTVTESYLYPVDLDEKVVITLNPLIC